MNINKKPHGIMYHHFHDNNKHIVGQGSISNKTFEEMLDYLEKEFNIINASDFIDKSNNKKLSNNDICITFDDGLLCQYDIALPVLKKRGIEAFWFIYSSPLCGIKEKLEIYRHFRFYSFKEIDDFYEAFFNFLISTDIKYGEIIDSFNPKDYLKDYPFYTTNDRIFRYLRDRVLGELKYYSIMDRMIKKYKYDVENNSKVLWMNSEQINDLSNHGHIIGIHSFSHPTVMTNKNKDEQLNEYYRNKIQLEEIVGKKIISASYPCNSFNNDTIECMKELGIQIAFRANMVNYECEYPNLVYSREDHTNIVREMRKE